jgi:hypothetical protein
MSGTWISDLKMEGPVKKRLTAKRYVIGNLEITKADIILGNDGIVFNKGTVINIK